MRSWEERDITDVLKAHHSDLVKASTELSDGGDYAGADEIDDDIKEEISDLVNDYLIGSCDLCGELRKLNFDPELLNWWPVNFSAV